MAKPRTTALKKAQAAYEADALAAGKHIQVALKLKTPGDVAMFERLRARFPDLKDTGIVRLAVKELAGNANSAPRKRKK